MKKDLCDFEYWEKRGETYKELDDVRSSRTAYKIIEMIKPLGLNAGSWILDAGCGRGNITRTIRDNLRHSNVVGIDLSQNMIDGALLKEAPRLKFFRADFFKFISEIFPFFDLVTMSLLIHHLLDGDDQRAINKAYSSLKDNGSILIAEAIPPDEKLFDYYKDIFRIKEERNCYLIQDLLKMVREAGFVDVNFMTYRFDIRLLSWLRDNTLSQAKVKLLYSMHVDASKEFKKAYVMEPLPDGDYRLRCKMAIVTGKKS